MKTYTLATDSGVITMIASTLAEALALIRSVPAHVTTPEALADWLEGMDGYGTLTEDGVVLARVAA